MQVCATGVVLMIEVCKILLYVLTSLGF